MYDTHVQLPLTPDASINRVVLHDLPGVTIDDGIRGQSAVELVGTPAVFEMIRAHAPALRIPAASVAELNTGAFILFDRCFEAGDETVRRTAQAIARRFGRNLGYVLLALRRPDALREDRPAWDAWMRAHWQTLSRLWVGGGLLRGHLGDRTIPYIRGVFTEAGTTPPDLLRDRYGAALPLAGAACCVPGDAKSAAVLDFGGTNVKRGAAAYKNGALHTLRTLSTLATDWNSQPDDNAALRRFLNDFMIACIADTVTAVQPDSRTVAVSIAAYIDESGQPYARQGSVYAALGSITGNLQSALTKAVSARLGRDIKVLLIHDGTAAASAHPGDAVMTLGTAVGMGYAPAVAAPRPVAADFALHQHPADS